MPFSGVKMGSGRKGAWYLFWHASLQGLMEESSEVNAARRIRSPAPYRAGVVVLLLAMVLCAGCSRRGWRWGGKQTRRDVYVNLMTPVQRAKYAYMEATGRPVSLRLAYLQEIGVYQTWAEQPKTVQEAILRREVLEGMTPLEVRMAWGPPLGPYGHTVHTEAYCPRTGGALKTGAGRRPSEKGPVLVLVKPAAGGVETGTFGGFTEEGRDETLPAERAAGHSRIIWDYGVRTQKVGRSSYERSVCFFDGRVLWVRSPG